MSQFSSHKAGYNALLGATTTPKRGEYSVFARTTARLNAAQKPDAKVGAKAAALHENRRLWIEVGAQVADEANQLDFELRQRLFALSVFVQTHSAKVINEKASIAPLVEINRSIMAGLQESKGEAA